MSKKWNRQHSHAAITSPQQWSVLEANLYSENMDQLALAADEWSGFMQPLREDLGDYPFNGFIAGDLLIEMGRSVDIDGTPIFTVLFFVKGADAQQKLAQGADALVDHLMVAGASLIKIQWETPAPRG